MPLEFHQIVDQVYRMGGMLTHIPNEHHKLMQLALERFNAAGDLARVRERIAWVRAPNVSGYRGAAPLELDTAEPINAVFDPPQEPPQAVIMACDGGQIYPNENTIWHYYLINVGLFVYFHGSGHTPIPMTFPQLVFHPNEVHDKYGRVVSNRIVDDRRTLAELRILSDHVRVYTYPDVPLLALYDNRLMYLPNSDDDSALLMRAFFDTMAALRDQGALLAGYVDNPFRSKRFLQLLYLLSLETQAAVHDQQVYLARCGDLEGLRDRDFFNHVLKPGQRSAVMVQNSPQNRDFKDRGRDFEIAFFYLKVVSALDETRVVRVDLPMWVARERAAVDAVHALLLSQCRLQGRVPYPYAIARADELAYVSYQDSRKLDEMIQAEARRARQELVLAALTAKATSKELARSPKRAHTMIGSEVIDRE